MSALSTVFAKGLLASAALPGLITTNKERLQAAYTVTTNFFKRAGIAYFPCNATVFLFCRLAPEATTVIDEMAAYKRYIEAGVRVVPGQAYHVNASQFGWMRLSFAVEQEELQRGLIRIRTVYQDLNQ